MLWWIQKNIFNQAVKKYIKTYNVRKIMACQGDDYTTDWLLDYLYFKEHYMLMATDVSKNQDLDADQKTMQIINIAGNLDQDRNTFFIIDDAKETILDFSQGTVWVL